MGILVLFLVLKEKLSVYYWWVWCPLWACHVWSLICWCHSFLFFLFIEGFYHEKSLNFVKCFFHIFWDNSVTFIFLFHLLWYIALINICMLNHPCIPVINFTWPQGIVSLMCCWILCARILLRGFAYLLIRDIGL